MLIGPLWVLFTATGLIFWLWFALVCVAIIASLEHESPGWALTSLIVGALLLVFFTDFVPRYNVYQHLTLRNAILFVVAYATCGVLYSFLRWYLFLVERLEHWKEVLADFREKFGRKYDEPVKLDDPVLMNYISKSHREYLVDTGVFNQFAIRVRPRPNRPRIIGWMVYWPWSLVWSLLDDIVTGFFRFLYRKISGGYDAMSRWMFSGIE